MNSNSVPHDGSIPWEAVVASAVHDMRTPLSAMYTTIEVLKLVGAPGKAAALLDRLEQQARELSEHLDRLVNDPGSYAPQSADG